jgi:zinc/manganese transport system substrate-binding protein
MKPLARFFTVLSLVMATSLPAVAAELRVVASFSILADFVRVIGGDRVDVIALVGADGDAHSWQPRPSDARTVLGADLTIANGLGFDEWMERLAAATGANKPEIVSAGIRTIEHDGHAHHGHDHGPLDPHAWQDVSNARIYAANIAAALTAADPAGTDYYHQRLADYDRQLEALDAEIRSRLAELPQEARKVVTSHDAFGYFDAAYGIRFVAAAGISSQSEVSAATMARLIRQLRREQAPVVFLENVNDPRLIERIGAETGALVGGTLYSDALSAPDGPALTYVDMMRHNLDTLIAGLGR